MLTIAVLSIIITAPVGSTLIALSGPKLLQKLTDAGQVAETVQPNYYENSSVSIEDVSSKYNQQSLEEVDTDSQDKINGHGNTEEVKSDSVEELTKLWWCATCLVNVITENIRNPLFFERWQETWTNQRQLGPCIETTRPRYWNWVIIFMKDHILIVICRAKIMFWLIMIYCNNIFEYDLLQI